MTFNPSCQQKCGVCGKEDYLLPDNICEPCAIENQRQYIQRQELGLD